ncbi:DegV family protein [Furfurilactobacillus sp. WILCCON 0119]|uniref:DegV family protein n=1 Tax=Furfurilactobacillus entadae TaxID=2922307 RepID=UPI0035E91C50
MKIAVLTDSSAYINAADQDRYHIYVINDPVLFGNHVYHENVDLDAKKFYALLKTEHVAPTTSQPSNGEVQRVLDQVVADGYDTAIIVGLSSGISGFISNVEAYAPTVDNLDVHIWDSRIACAGAGNQVLLAAALAEKGHSVDEIFARLAQLRETTKVMFVVDDMRHLMRTGRISNGQSLIGTMLQIKPMLAFTPEGKIIATGRERQMKRAFLSIQKQFAEIVATTNYPLRVSIVDANNADLKAQWLAASRAAQPSVIFEDGIIGPLIGVHTGEKAMGFIYAQDWRSLVD